MEAKPHSSSSRQDYAGNPKGPKAPGPIVASEATDTGRWPAQLLAGFRAGEQSALTEIYRLHVEEVARLLRCGFSFDSRGTKRRFVGYRSPFEFQDALHETFLRAFEPKAREGYDGIRPYAPYLLTIARNIVLKSFRRREVLFPNEEEPATALRGNEGERGQPANIAPTSGSVPLSPEVDMHHQSVRKLVASFLAKLDESDRNLIALRFEQKMSQRDAADVLKIGRQRIRARELKLRKQLLEFLHQRGESHLIPTAPTAMLALLGLQLNVASDVFEVLS